MAPRFVEISKPVDVGVAWVTSFSNSARTTIVRTLSDASNYIPSISSLRVVSDVRHQMEFAMDGLPPARREAKYLIIASFVAFACRCLVVFVRSRSILAHHSAAKIIGKDA